MRRSKLLYPIAICLAVAVLVVGCSNPFGADEDEDGSSGKDDSAGPATSTANHDVYLPEGVDTYDGVSGDVDGVMTFAGGQADSSGTSTAALGDRDMVGFIAERPALGSATDAGGDLNEMLNKLYNAGYNLSSTGTQTFASINAVVGEYNLTLSSAVTPTELANDMFDEVGVNTSGGVINGKPDPSDGERTADEFEVILAVVWTASDDVVVLGAVVPLNLAENYGALTSGSTNPTNVGEKGAGRESETDSFTASGGGGKADFLFVVDNSGSMGGDQTAVSQAANEFGNRIQSSGLDFSIGTITTDSDTLVDTNGDGGFTDDISEFESDVQVGTGGSFTETGIWFAEQALQSVAEGDSSDGTVTAAGHPRADASLSVVILSDEDSQYESRSDGASFDPANNLFIDRGYRVYSIIDPADDDDSQYDELANQSGGSTADITDNSTFPSVMTNIAVNAGGASSMFQLSQTPIASTIGVTVNGSTVANSNTNGWIYNVGSNTIIFNGTALPENGDSVEVSYEYYDSSSSSSVTSTAGAVPGVVTSVDALVR